MGCLYTSNPTFSDFGFQYIFKLINANLPLSSFKKYDFSFIFFFFSKYEI